MSLHVLVVEDDDLLRPLTIEAVELLGFEVSSCTSADEALQWLSRLRPALVITDVQMPGRMDGLELAFLITGKWPSLPIIITSGVALPIITLPPGAAFLSKPASVEALHQLVHASLGTADPPD